MNDKELKILIIQTAFPGDAILTLPLIQEIKKKFSHASIGVLCIKSTEEIFSVSPHVNFVHVLEKHGKHKSIFGLLKFIRDLKKEKYNVIFSPHRSFRTGLITLLLDAEESTGFSSSSFKYAFKKVAEYDYSAHEVKRNLSLIRNDLDAENWKILPRVEVSNDITQKVSNYLADKKSGIGFIGIAPGSIWNTKIYPADYYKEIIKKLIAKNYMVVLIGGETDRDIGENIRHTDETKIINACGEFTFIESIELLKHCKLLICNDSAPTHLAMCADIPVVIIYCSTSPLFGFYPYNGKSKFISFDELTCKPCGIHGYKECPIGTFDCAHKLTPGFIFSEIENLLN